ncbi:polyprenyl synthetase family protein [Thermococcus thioreducens]|uniref:Farnesyl-diphosphate synthase /geranylgeranyl-diphosphate synthase n=1 Tax=Thermococcus thioreducens TaxID=277988 RepID=A0A0Q2QP95_9EURY|nr:polyprenyl synthetase family protein [Thermococcus thioreducens]ASJ11896.1 serralysin [Thermococcus thioreducens]KQH81693.1 serralysin [Thermococcus thioreducens]SEW11856.1 farnesyl-diphosphate synthase /geranylgeranyl-diphosphate synthase [Thermococcus thioreducens]
MGKYDELFARVKETAKDVDKAIFELIPEKEPDKLYDAARHYPLAGGKRVRPFVVLRAAEAVGGDPVKALYPAAAVEFIHNYSLVHDDIMDMDELRRGRPTVHKIWGVNMAILAGDLLFSKAFEAVAKAEVSPEKKARILEVLVQTSNELCEGQALDIEFETREEVTVDEYLRMISGKTGALFDGSATIGAIVGTEDEEYIQALSKWGRNVGIAFQIWDDVLDLIADEEKLGKPVGSDIRKGKKTLIVGHFFDNATEKDKAEFLKVFGKYAGDAKGDALIHDEKVKEEVARAIELLRKYGSIDYAAEYAKNLVREANEALKVLPESEARKDLELLAEFLVEREF